MHSNATTNILLTDTTQNATIAVATTSCTDRLFQLDVDDDAAVAMASAGAMRHHNDGR